MQLQSHSSRSLIATKHDQLHSKIISWMCCVLGFGLPRSVITCHALSQVISLSVSRRSPLHQTPAVILLMSLSISTTTAHSYHPVSIKHLVDQQLQVIYYNGRKCGGVLWQKVVIGGCSSSVAKQFLKSILLFGTLIQLLAAVFLG